MHYLGCENVNEVMIGIVSMSDPSDFLVGYCKDAKCQPTQTGIGSRSKRMKPSRSFQTVLPLG